MDAIWPGPGTTGSIVLNLSRATLVGERVRKAESFLARLAGLLGTCDLPPGSALWIAPCRGVHTFGMRYPIDVALLGPGGIVLEVCPELPPNRVSRIRRDARGALELPAGTLATTGTSAGDRLEFRPLSVPLTPPTAG